MINKKRNGTLGRKTQSICPICASPIKAEYIEENNKIYLKKKCEMHGEFKALVSNDASDYENWMNAEVVNVPPKKAITKGSKSKESECPLHCGTCENHLQTACCVVIDITNRCNQHCPYCFACADEGSDRKKEPSFKELEEKLDLLLELGEERPFNLQFSGGEPTVRDDLPDIIKMARTKGFEYIQINTNGKRLGEENGYAKKLKDAGATVMFMQFDGTREDIYIKLRGKPLLEVKKRAIENCKKARLPVTIVPTIVKEVNLDNIGDMISFLLKNISVIKGIHFQPVSFFGRYPDEKARQEEEFSNRVTMFDIMHELERQNDYFKYNDFCPIKTGHPLCCFYSVYLKEPDGKLKCLVSENTKNKGVSCCETDPLDIIKKDRDFVLDKWDVPEVSEQEVIGNTSCCCEEPEKEEAKCCCGEEVIDIDSFLALYKNNTFTVTGMAFQDKSNLDGERLKRCRVQVLSEDNKLIPFCSYNSMYRGE